MSILKINYNGYVEILRQTKIRMKRDKKIVKILQGMINNKRLSDKEINELNELLLNKSFYSL